MSMRRTALLLPALALAGGLAACGGDDSTTKGTTVPVDLVVVSDNIAWTKTAYEATATNGKVVIELRNDDLVGHNLHAVSSDGKDAGTVLDANPKGTDVGTFTLAPGAYTLICTIPGHANMKATLTVK